VCSLLKARTGEKITNPEWKSSRFFQHALFRHVFFSAVQTNLTSDIIRDTEHKQLALTSYRELTELLRGWSGGDQSALARIVDMTYPELRKIARRCLSGERSEHTIQATALVHEAYLRLVDIRQVRWQERAQFFAIVAKVMRRILIEHARARGSSKRGGGAGQSISTKPL
jgi:hypothetical protein